MKPSIWSREAFEDTRTGASRPWLWGFTFFLLLAAVCGWDVWSISRVSEEASDFRNSGSSTWITDSIDGISGRSCDDLASQEGVSRSGAMAGMANIRLQVMPNTPVSTFRVTPGFAELIVGGDLAVTPGVLISYDLASEIHATKGSTFESMTGPVTFDEVYAYPSDGRLASLQNAILIVDEESVTFDACWYEIWPFSETAAGIGIMTAEDPSTVERSQLNSRNGIEFDLPAEVEALKVWLLIGATLAVAGVLGWIAIRSRRSELASALHSTVTRGDLAVIISLETLIWTLPAAVVALGASAMALSLVPVGPVPILPASVGLVSAAIMGALSGALLATLSINPNRLFTYLRDRR